MDSRHDVRRSKVRIRVFIRMTAAIKNKIDEAGLVTLDVSELVITGDRKELDLSVFLDEGLIIRESFLRKKLRTFEWGQFKNCFVAITCSKDVIIPPWSYLLIQMNLRNIAKEVFFCNLKTMDLLLFQKALTKLDMNNYKNKRVFLKVCSNNTIPLVFLSLCVSILTPHVKSLFYGEPCSSVPLIKN